MGGLLIHEWIEKSGGSEKVFDAFVGAFPTAELFCLWNDDVGRYGARDVAESWLARSPLRRHKALALPFMPATWNALNLDGYDWSLSSSHLFAHHAGGFKSSNEGVRRHVYVHSPARYLWTPKLDRRGDSPLVRFAAPPLRALDRSRARRSSASFAANSDFVRQRIVKSWGVDSRVIYPPVDVRKIQSRQSWVDELDAREAAIVESLPDTFVLGASRFVPYKRLDLVVKAGEYAGVPVVLAGSGSSRPFLEHLASEATVPVVFINDPSNALLFALYQRALVYIFPAIEDFGIMPVEAMAAGASVLVADVGGATESVIDGVSGIHVRDWSRVEVSAAIEKASGLRPADSEARSRDFDADVFRKRISRWVEGEDAWPAT